MGNGIGLPQGGQFASGASHGLAEVAAIIGGIQRGKLIRQMKADRQLQEQYQMAVMQYKIDSQQMEQVTQVLLEAQRGGNAAQIRTAQDNYNKVSASVVDAENQVKAIAQQITEYDAGGSPSAPKRARGAKPTTKAGEVSGAFQHAARSAYNALTSILSPQAAPQQVFRPTTTQGSAPEPAPPPAAKLNPYPAVGSPAPLTNPSQWSPVGGASTIKPY